MECRKFEANMFNQAKCATCYKLKENHTSAALEVSKASRHVTRCGFLFVAPDWDFTNPVYRTKRWQRRWFVLYDDGELTYAIDDHPETLPQATINMAGVFEITEADAITGNAHSIAIVAPDGIHFIKGSCAEESRLWIDILKLFSQCNTTTLRKEGATGRAKRSATFPGISRLAKVSSIKQQQQQQQEQHNSSAPVATLEEQREAPQIIPSQDINKTDLRLRHFSERSEEDEEESSEDDEEDEVTEDDEEDEDEEIYSSEEQEDEDEEVEDDEDEEVEPPAKEPSAIFLRRNYSGLSFRAPAASIPVEELDDPVAPAGGAADDDEELLSSSSRRSSVLSGPSPGRGIPDGGNTAAAAATTSVKEKKGWLMKETSPSNWHKYWFVLKDGALMYYRDPSAELKGFLDGVLGLNTVESVREETLDKNFGFKLRTSEPRVHRFSAVTAGIRHKWMETIKGQMCTDLTTVSSFSSLEALAGSNSSTAAVAAASKSPYRTMDGGFHIRPIRRSFKFKSAEPTPERTSGSEDEQTQQQQSGQQQSNPAPVVATTTATATANNSSNKSDEPPEAVVAPTPSLHDKLLSLHTQLDTQKDLLQEQKTENFRLRRQMEQLDAKLAEASVQTRLESEKVMELLQENSALHRTAQEHKASADKWKDLYDSIYLQVGKCQGRIGQLERLHENCDAQLTAKDQIISDLSDQLQDSEERIQDLIAEIDVIKQNLEDNKNEYEDSLSRVILAMDHQYNDKMESQRKHYEEEKESAKAAKLESELSLKQYVESYYPQFSTTSASSSVSEPAHEIFADLYARFQQTLRQTQALKQSLRESTALNDSLEVEKICLEQALKRTIKLNEDEEKMLVTRIQDLTNKLVTSEKNLRIAKERRASRSKRSASTVQMPVSSQQQQHSKVASNEA